MSVNSYTHIHAHMHRHSQMHIPTYINAYVHPHMQLHVHMGKYPENVRKKYPGRKRPWRHLHGITTLDV